MFKLLQNEYEEYQEYFNELELIQRQYNQEEAYYFIINKLIRDSINDKDISVRDVHKLIRANDFPGRNSCLRGYARQVPDFVILDNDFDESKGEGQSGKVYGCVEIKAFSLENKKLDRNYIQPIKDLLKNKELVKVVHEELRQKGMKIEFESRGEKKEFIENYFTKDYKSIPIDVMGELFLCYENGNLCKNESKELIKQKLLKIQKQNDKESLVLRDSEKDECEYCVELRNGKRIGVVYEMLEEVIGFKKVIFTNGYQWILMQCQCENKDSEDKKVNDFQCKSLANFYPEPKQEETFEKLKREQGQDMSDMSEKLDAEKQELKIPLTEFQKDEDFKAWTAMTFAELRQHNFKQWLHLKFEINRIFKEAKSQNKQGEEKIGNDK